MAAVVTAWTVTAAVLAHRAKTSAEASMIETQHLLVWVTATLAHMLSGLTAMFVLADGVGDIFLWWVHVVVLLVGWALIHGQAARRLSDQ